MLYLDCQHDPVRLTEHLRGTRESEQKKRGLGGGDGSLCQMHEGPTLELYSNRLVFTGNLGSEDARMSGMVTICDADDLTAVGADFINRSM